MSRLWITLCLAGLPAAAHAAAEGFAGLAWESLNLILLLGVLVYVARRPVMNYLAERRRGIQHNLATSEQLLTQAEARLGEWNERAARLDQEAASIREAARRSGEQERESIVAEARVTAERIRQSAGVAVERELRRARESLRDDAAELAIELAGKLLSEQLAVTDEDRLFDEFLQKVDDGGAR